MKPYNFVQSGAAVVTGAASGMGRECALQLARMGANVALLDRDEEGLERLQNEILNTLPQLQTKVSSHVVDVTDAQSVAQAAVEIEEIHGGAHILINSAGSSMLGSFEQLTLEEFAWLIDVNMWGTIIPCKIFLPLLQKSPEAHISNLSSAYALIAPAGRTPYATSKYAIRGFTESLRHELQGTSIGVSVVHPGGIATGLVGRARVAAAADPEVIARATKAQLAEYGTSPQSAAEQILLGIRNRKDRVMIGKDAKGLDMIARIFPTTYWKFLRKRLAAATET